MKHPTAFNNKKKKKNHHHHQQKQRPHNRNSVHVECASKSDTSYNRGDWNHFRITQTIPEQHNRKVQN
jgi:hypothetical protein